MLITSETVILTIEEAKLLCDIIMLSDAIPKKQADRTLPEQEAWRLVSEMLPAIWRAWRSRRGRLIQDQRKRAEIIAGIPEW